MAKSWRKLLNEENISVQTSLAVGRRMGRSSADISPSISILTTVESHLTSLCKHLGKQLSNRLTENPTPILITTLRKCFDLEDILVNLEDDKVTDEMKKKNVDERAKYNEEQIEKILDQYITFVEKFQRLTVAGSEYDEIVNRFEHILFQTHIFSSGCDKRFTKKGKVLQPRKPKVFKFLHIFWRNLHSTKDLKISLLSS